MEGGRLFLKGSPLYLLYREMTRIKSLALKEGVVHGKRPPLRLGSALALGRAIRWLRGGEEVGGKEKAPARPLRPPPSSRLARRGWSGKGSASRV